MWYCRDPFEVQRLKYFHLFWVNSENASHNSSVSLHKQYPSQKLVKVSHLIVLLIILMMNSLYIPSWFGGFSGRATGINLSSYDSSSIFPVYPFQKETHCAGPRPSITTALWWPKGLPVLSSSSWHKSSTAERAILGQKGVAVIKCSSVLKSDSIKNAAVGISVYCASLTPNAPSVQLRRFSFLTCLFSKANVNQSQIKVLFHSLHYY